MRVVLALLGVAWGTSVLVTPSLAWAWDFHASFMPWAVDEVATSVQSALDQPLTAPCPDEDEKFYKSLVDQAALNVRAKLPSYTAKTACQKKEPMTPRQILLGGFVDDLDKGMDENLNLSPDQAFMGGTLGLTSKGFRHMYFGGWKPTSPFSTFQLPLRPLGQAHLRAELYGDLAKKWMELSPSSQAAWGWRVLSWSIHYVQDLGQPFHAVQVPNLWMVPWRSLLDWTPEKGFSDLVADTTRSISNYHWSFESYAERTFQRGDHATFAACLQKGDDARFRDDFDQHGFDPRRIAVLTAHHSIEIARSLGESEMAYVGEYLKEKDIDIPNKVGTVNWDALAKKPNLIVARERFDQATCRALANTVMATRRLIEWALQP